MADTATQSMAEVVTVYEPRLDFATSRVNAVVGGDSVIYIEQTNQSANIQAQSYLFKPMGNNAAVDRTFYWKNTIKFAVTATNVSAPDNSRIISQGNFAPRAYPMSNSLKTLGLQINGANITMPLKDVFPAIQRINSKHLYKFSNQCPWWPDTATDYAVYGPTSIRNPLTTPDNFIYEDVPRGGWPMDISSNPQAAVGATVTCTGSFTTVEPLFISPLLWGEASEEGMLGIQQLQLTMSMDGLMERVLSFNNLNPDGDPNNPRWTVTNVTITLGSASLIVGQVVPKSIQPISLYQSLPYYEVLTFPKTFGAGLVAGATKDVTSDSLIVKQVPNRILIYAVPTTQGITVPDWTLCIDNINITFAGRAGILANAPKEILYRISAGNGYSASYQDFAGLMNGPVTGNFQLPYGGVGSIVVLNPSVDMGLPGELVSGLKGSQLLTVQVTFRNQSRQDLDAQGAQFFIALINDGQLVTDVEHLSTQPLSGIVDSSIVLKGIKAGAHATSYVEAKNPFGGSFLDSLSRVASGAMRAANAAAKVVDAAKQGVDFGRKVGIIGRGESGAGYAGAGYSGAGYSGGKRLSKARLRALVE